MRIRLPHLTLMMVATAALTACGGAPAATESGSVATPSGQPTAPAASATPLTGTAPPSSGGPVAGTPLFGDFESLIVLRTPTAGGGSRPLLEWDGVDGVDHYAVYLHAPDGRIYWSWSGRQTSVHVGGEPPLREGAPGPSVAAGMTWAVVAYDADLLPITTSEIRPISP